MTALKKPILTAEAYLAMEREAGFKSEYVDGEVFAMAGTTRRHSLIVGNCVREVGNQLKGRPCEVHPSDLKVWLDVVDTFAYPDVSGLCGPVRFFDERRDVYLNPQFIIEVLSDSTESYDRGDKFYKYQTLTSLQEYVLISQREVAVDVFRRTGDEWVYQHLGSLDANLALRSVDCSVPLAEIYDKVDFSSDAAVNEAS